MRNENHNLNFLDLLGSGTLLCSADEGGAFPPEYAWVLLQGGPCHYNARNCRICQNRYQASVIHLIPPGLAAGRDILPCMNTDPRRRRKPIRRNSTISGCLRHGTPWELQLQRPWWDLTTALDLHPLSLLWPCTQERR